MGKGKNKKETRYKAPDEKFLVVIDPWGMPGNPSFINNVGAWFEIMLMQDYPGESVRAIYTQKTHNHIIVELSEDVEIEPLLGAHIHSKFLSPPHNYIDGVSYIYEYDYEKQHHPGRRSWSAAVPTYEKIPHIFPIKQPYPIPSPAPLPPYNVNYAKRPKNVSILGVGFTQHSIEPVPGPSSIHLGELTSAPETTTNQTHNSMAPQELPPAKITGIPYPVGFTPVPVPKYGTEETLSDVLVKKRDPYEEADDAERLLRNEVFPSSRVQIKQETETAYSSASEFLDSVLPVKKEGPIAHLNGGSIKRENQAIPPPPEAALSPVPRIKKEEFTNPLPPPFDRRSAIPRVKAEENPNYDLHVKKEEPSISVHRSIDRVDGQSGDNYQPSADLLAAFAGLPQEFLAHASSTRSNANILSHADAPIVKKERTEDFVPPVDGSRERSSTLATDRGSREPSVVVKPEPQDYEKVPPLQPTRDPRLMGRGKGPVKHLREESANDADRDHYLEMTKRIKHEQE